MRKREPRRKVMLPARMRVEGEWVDVSIRNISSRGMLIVSPHPIARGAYVEIRRQANTVIGRAVWQDGRHFGLFSQDRLDVDAIVASPRSAAARSVEGSAERRGEPRDVRWIAEGSRHRGASLQYATLAIAAIAAAMGTAGAVNHVLQTPLLAIEQALSGPND